MRNESTTPTDTWLKATNSIARKWSYHYAAHMEQHALSQWYPQFSWNSFPHIAMIAHNPAVNIGQILEFFPLMRIIVNRSQSQRSDKAWF